MYILARLRYGKSYCLNLVQVMIQITIDQKIHITSLLTIFRKIKTADYM